jgi:hypothetical protein
MAGITFDQLIEEYNRMIIDYKTKTRTGFEELVFVGELVELVRKLNQFNRVHNQLPQKETEYLVSFEEAITKESRRLLATGICD